MEPSIKSRKESPNHLRSQAGKALTAEECRISFKKPQPDALPHPHEPDKLPVPCPDPMLIPACTAIDYLSVNSLFARALSNRDAVSQMKEAAVMHCWALLIKYGVEEEVLSVSQAIIL